MSDIRSLALQFTEANDAGEGWDTCRAFCQPGATFAFKGALLRGIDTVEAYTEWIKANQQTFPDFGGDVGAVGVDEARGCVLVYGANWGTHTGEGGPVPPTGKRFEVEGVNVITFAGDKIRHMTLVVNEAAIAEQLGWA